MITITGLGGDGGVGGMEGGDGENKKTGKKKGGKKIIKRKKNTINHNRNKLKAPWGRTGGKEPE